MFVPNQEILDKCFEIYCLFYNNRLSIQGAPEMRLSPEKAKDPFDTETYEIFRTDLQGMVYYMLGLNSAKNVDIGKMLDQLEAYYKPEDFWYNVLHAYIEVAHKEEEIILNAQKQALIEETQSLLNDLRKQEKQKIDLINSISDTLHKKGYTGDINELLKRYIALYEKNPDKAFKILTENPYYYTPIATGKQKIKPKEAYKLNEGLAKFFANYDSLHTLTDENDETKK